MDELENYYFVPSPAHETARILVNKKEFYKSLKTFNIPHPDTYFPESLVDLRRIASEIKYPIFVKPAISEDFYRTFYRKGFLANNKLELFRYCSLAWKNDLEIILQKIISGIDARNVYCIESYLDRSSNSKGVFVSLRVRGWPPVFGNTCLRESISPLEITEQVSITLSYLKSIQYHGLMEAEWKRDITDGTFKLLEINARQSMQNSLPSRCGMNLMLIAYLDKIHREQGSVNVYNYGVKWCDLFNDLQSVRKTHASFKDWISTLKNPIEWSNFATDDFWPWFISLFETARSTIKKTEVLLTSYRSSG
jgi:D-aspartate ligase